MKLLPFIFILSCITVAGQKKPKKITNPLGDPSKYEIYYLLNNQKNGAYSSFFKNQKMVDGSYVKDKKDGAWTHYDKEGRCIIKAFYKNDRKFGIWQYFQNDTLISLIHYDTITNIDTLKGFFANGKLAHIKIRDNKSDRAYFVKYHPNGNKMEEGYYNNDKINGPLKRYNAKGDYIMGLLYKNGNPFTLMYTNDSLSKGYNLYTGTLQAGNGNLKIFSSDLVRLPLFELNFKNGLLDGIYKDFYPNGSPKAEGEYMKGFMINQWKLFDENKQVAKTTYYSLSDSITSDIGLGFNPSMFERKFEKLPRFQSKSPDTFRNFIASRIKYPELAAENGIQGRVFVQFSINTLGEIVDSKIIKGVDLSLDKEALRLLTLSPNWETGYQYYLPVKVQFTFPIAFTIDNPSDEQKK